MVLTEEFILEILNYAREYGPVAAHRKYKISVMTITKYNKIYKVYEFPTVYTPAMRAEIVDFLCEHGMAATKKKYDVADATLYKWHLQIHGYKYNGRRTLEQKREAIEYVDKYGRRAGARKYGVTTAVFTVWRKEVGMVRPPRTSPVPVKKASKSSPRDPSVAIKARKRYTDEFKIEVLEYARDHGVMAAVHKYHIPDSRLRAWNAKLKIYTPGLHRMRHKIGKFSEEQRRAAVALAQQTSIWGAALKMDCSACSIAKWAKIYGIDLGNGSLVSYSREFKIEVLEYARDHSPTAAAIKYNINVSRISVWNYELKIYEARRYRTYTVAQRREIVDYARKNSFSKAVLIFDIEEMQIRKWAAKLASGYEFIK